MAIVNRKCTALIRQLRQMGAGKSVTNSTDRLNRLEAIIAIKPCVKPERLQRAELQAAVVGVNEAIQRLTTFNEGLVNLLDDRPFSGG